MKSAGNDEGTQPRRKRAAMVRLNIGGLLFDTSRDTLSKCEYFAPFLAGRLCHAEDRNGRLFIDRSGTLFAHLLQFMRTNSLPSRKLTHDIKHDLVHECAFFGLPLMAHRLCGEISVYDMRLEDRELKEDECGGTYKLLDVFAADTSHNDPAGLRVPLLPKFGDAQRHQIVKTYGEFRQRFDKITGGLLDHLSGVAGIVFAGGSVLGALTGTRIGDVDVFLCCPQAEAMGLAERVFTAVQTIHKHRNGDAADLLVTRSSHALTFFQLAINIISSYLSHH